MKRRKLEPENIEESWLILEIECFLFFSTPNSLCNNKPVVSKIYVLNMIKIRNQSDP